MRYRIVFFWAQNRYIQIYSASPQTNIADSPPEISARTTRHFLEPV